MYLYQKHHSAHLKYIQYFFVNHTWIKLGKNAPRKPAFKIPAQYHWTWSWKEIHTLGWLVSVSSFSRTLRLCLITQSCLTLVTPWTVACQAPLSMGFSRHAYRSGLPFSSPGLFPTQGSNPGLLNHRQTLYQLSHQGSRALSLSLIGLFWCMPIYTVSSTIQIFFMYRKCDCDLEFTLSSKVLFVLLLSSCGCLQLYSLCGNPTDNLYLSCLMMQWMLDE